MLRVADPFLHVRGRIGEMPADDDPQGHAVERWADHPRRGAHVLQRMAASAAVLDEHGFAAPRIALNCSGGMLTKARSLLRIFPADRNERDQEDRRRKDAEEGLSGD